VTNYQKDLLAARARLVALLKERENIETAIARHRRKLAALIELSGEADFDNGSVDLNLGGLTEACIIVLRGSHKEWLNTSEVQNALRELGFPIHTYKAPNASIATTLNRLVGKRYVAADKKVGEGAIEYKWVGRYVEDAPAPKAAKK